MADLGHADYSVFHRPLQFENIGVKRIQRKRKYFVKLNLI